MKFLNKGACLVLSGLILSCLARTEEVSPENFEPEKTYVVQDGDSMTSSSEREFLNGLIRKYKPKKILEVGVSRGGTSLVLLHAAKDIGAEVYGIDISQKLYIDRSKETGYLVSEKEPELHKKWKLYTDGIAANFMDKIGDGIDFVFFDAAHRNPGELLDFLMVLPYLKPGAIVVFHDINLHYSESSAMFKMAWTNCVSISNIRGKKIIPSYPDPNIGAIELDDNQKDYLFEYFNILNLPWVYMPSDEHLDFLLEYFEKHYGKKWSDMFKKTIERQKKRSEEVKNDKENLGKTKKHYYY